MRLGRSVKGVFKQFHRNCLQSAAIQVFCRPTGQVILTTRWSMYLGRTVN
ncbi:hypothetical protein SynBIOSU31_02711 [Synechococcus sp. BIOS-U3-1]|nr:hypothetical protein SynBIOSU31_02711 [Synechococcus sp. BIOS-U3-1]